MHFKALVRGWSANIWRQVEGFQLQHPLEISIGTVDSQVYNADSFSDSGDRVVGRVDLSEPRKLNIEVMTSSI